MKILFISLGCDKNLVDSEHMLGLLVEHGFEITDSEEDAEVIVINTCCFIHDAKEESIQNILEMAKYRTAGSCKVLLVTGCMAERYRDEIIEEIPEVDAVLGTNSYDKILDAIQDVLGGDRFQEYADLKGLPKIDAQRVVTTGGHYEYLKIAEGCDKHCTYCIIPYTRGRVRSRKIEDIIDEVRKLAESGCHEIVVTGIHLSSYGLDFDNTEYNAQPVPNAERLLQVLEAIAAVDEIDRIRLGSLEPRIITDTFLERLSAIPQICPHFHLSLQSGCDETLKRMNRRYDTEEFREGVEKIRRYFDKPAITTDVIVGFPGETDEEFAITRKYLEEINFFEMHVFKYSRRKGTIADRMENQIPDGVKSERSDALIELDEELSRAYRESFAGSAEVVLVEEYVECDGIKYAVGHTKRYVKVYISLDCAQAQDIKINAEIPVIITGIFGKDSVISKVAIAN